LTTKHKYYNPTESFAKSAQAGIKDRELSRIIAYTSRGYEIPLTSPLWYRDSSPDFMVYAVDHHEFLPDWTAAPLVHF